MTGRYVALVGIPDDAYIHNMSSIDIFTERVESGKKQ
jgi:hypothetical protein